MAYDYLTQDLENFEKNFELNKELFTLIRISIPVFKKDKTRSTNSTSVMKLRQTAATKNSNRSQDSQRKNSSDEHKNFKLSVIKFERIPHLSS